MTTRFAEKKYSPAKPADESTSFIDLESKPEDFIASYRKFLGIFSLNEFEYDLLRLSDEKFFKRIIRDSQWLSISKLELRDLIAPYVQIALAKISTEQNLEEDIDKKIISFIQAIPKFHDELRAETYIQFIDALFEMKRHYAMGRCLDALLLEIWTAYIYPGEKPLSAKERDRYKQEALIPIVEKALELGDTIFLKSFIEKIKLALNFPNDPILFAESRALFAQVAHVLGINAQRDELLQTAEELTTDISEPEKYPTLFDQQRISSEISLIQSFLVCNKETQIQPHIETIHRIIDRSPSFISSKEAVFLASLSLNPHISFFMSPTENYLELAYQRMADDRAFITWRDKNVQAFTGYLAEYGFTNFIKTVLRREQAIYDERLVLPDINIVEGVNGGIFNQRQQDYAAYKMLIETAAEHGFSNIALELVHNLQVYGREDSDGEAYTEALEGAQQGFLKSHSPIALDFLQTGACFTDQYKNTIGTYYSDFYAIARSASKTNSIDSVRVASLMSSDTAELRSLCEQKVLDTQEDEGYLAQLAFLTYKIPPTYAQFWIDSGLIPATYQSEEKLEQSLLFLRKMTHDDQFKLAYFVRRDVQDAILDLSAPDKMVLRDKKTLFYVSNESIVKANQLLAKETDPRRKQSLVQFFRKLFNEFPSHSLEGALWCIALSSGTPSELRSKNLESIDWTDKEEQQFLRQAINELGGITPKVFSSYRSLWLIPSNREKPLIQKTKDLLGKAKMYRDLLSKEQDQVKMRKFHYQLSSCEQELSITLEAPEQLVKALRTVRERLHQNTPLSILQAELLTILEPYIEEGDSTQALDILCEIVFLLYSPIGFTYETVKQILQDEQEGLLASEELTTQQVSNSGLRWDEHSSVEMKDGIAWDEESQTFQTKLVNSPQLYSLFRENVNEFASTEEEIVNILRALPDSFRVFLKNTRKGVETLLSILQKNQSDTHTLAALRAEIFRNLETFGVWFEDNKEKIQERGKISDDDIRKIDELRQKLLPKLHNILKGIHVERDTTQEETFENVDIYLSKNAASFFAKAAVGLCTAEDLSLFKRADHFHLNFVDHESKEILANLQLYIVESKYLPENERDGVGERFLLIRGLNPGERYISGDNVASWENLFYKAALRLAKQSGITRVFLTESTSFHPHTNRPTMDAELQNYYLNHTVVKLTEPYFITDDAKINRVFEVA